MLYFRSVGEAENVFKALSTPMRVKIMEMIYEDDSLSMIWQKRSVSRTAQSPCM